jgi:NAD(P)H-hydrate repair Nnr-like enzyme with NAD(P)H-hydrate dehydratase domain
MEQDYWRKQEADRSLFPDVEWSKPEQRARRGKLLVAGGSRYGFRAVAGACQTALAAGAGEVKAVLPDKLKSQLPADFREGIFLPSNDGGGLGLAGQAELLAAADWADGVLLIGDSGMNSETGVLFDKLLEASDRPVTISRDALDLLTASGEKLVNRPKTHLIANFTQLQKLFSTVYYPKILTHSMNLLNLVEAVHKFTTTYPISVTTLHQNSLLTAVDGQVVSQKFANQLALIDGQLAAQAAAYLLWTPDKPLEAIVSSWLTPNGKV